MKQGVSVTVRNNAPGWEVSACEVDGVPVDPRSLPLVLVTPDGKPARVAIGGRVRIYEPGEAAAEILAHYPKPGA